MGQWSPDIWDGVGGGGGARWDNGAQILGRGWAGGGARWDNGAQILGRGGILIR